MTRALRFAVSTGMVLGLLSTIATGKENLASPGKNAPEFTLMDLNGKQTKLTDFRGKYVVLEWVNPGCPFVQKHYNSGNMPRLQKSSDVAWLTINSTNPQHQDYKTAKQLREWLNSKDALPTAALLDPDGKVGQLYGAKTTPHMFVIDPQGVLIYAGAIDDKRTVDPADVPRAKNFVVAALTEARAGKPISQPSTSAYGCTVKYGP